MKPDHKPYAVVAGLLLASWAGLEVRAAVGGGEAALDADRERAHTAAFVALEACFIGPPLEPGEALDARVRAVDAARRLDPAVEDEKGKGAWPKRCAALSSRLGKAITAGDGNSYVAGIAEAFAATLERGVPDQLALVTFASISSSYFDADRGLVPPEVARAPAPARPLLAMNAGHFPEGAIWNRGVERDDELRASISGLPMICRVRTDRAEARCLAVPDGAGRGPYGAHVGSAPSGGPLIGGYGSERGSSVVDFDAGRTLLEEPGYLAGAGVAADRTVLVWSVTGKKRELVIAAPGGKPRREPSGRDGAIVFGELLISATEGDGTSVRAIQASGEIGAETKIPLGAEWQSEGVRACHVGDDLVVAAPRRTGEVRSTLVLVRRQGRWAHHEIGLPSSSMACHGQAALFLPDALPDAGKGPIERFSCSFDGCQATPVPAPSFFVGMAPGPGSAAPTVALAACGDRIVAAARNSTTVEIVVAAPSDLATAPRRILYQSDLVHSVALLAGSGGVIALVGAYEGRTMARIGCDGAVEVVETSFQASGP